MHEYEIRVLRQDNTTSCVLEVVHLNDHAAVRAGRKIAGESAFEVWRDLDCIYGPHRPPPS